MLTRLFLAAGVAALAIAAPAYADPGGGRGGGHGGGGGPHGGGGPPAFAGGGPHGGGGGGGGGGPHGGGGPPAFAGGGGHGHGGGAPAFAGFRGGGGPHWGGGQRFAPPQMRAPQMRGFTRQSFRMAGAQRAHGFAQRGYRMAGRGNGRGFARQQFRMSGRQQAHGFARQQLRMSGRQQAHGFARQQLRMAQQGHGFARQNGRMAERQTFQPNRIGMAQQPGFATAREFGGPGRGSYGNNGQLAPQQFAAQRFAGNSAQFADRQFANGTNWSAAPYSSLSYGNNVQVLPVQEADRFIGAPVAQVAAITPLSPLPAEIQYLYPATPDYYYEWGDGYLYQIDRGTNLIDALIPLLAGGYLPGQYLPAAYMADYVPSTYDFNAFYPDDGDLCNRYYEGVVYEVDCSDGYVEDVVPVYANGYGVGELLPAAYSYYNVPLQYRGIYYDTPDAAYWYAPGAIYQYDPRSSVITSVAALMSPGFAIGQPLPVGYQVYNVPYAYRATYYDTPSAWYRYSNGYIYQVDPVTQLVTAIVASLLT